MPVDPPLALGLAFVGGLIASAVNAVAGGGTLISFPLLIFGGLPELNANATNAVALWPGSASSAFAFRDRVRRMTEPILKLVLPTIVGTSAGAIMLVNTEPSTFRLAVPVLILVATLLLAVQTRIRDWSARTGHGRHPVIGGLLQLLISVYGGYFGAGMGIMMLAAMSLFVDGDLKEVNAMKNVLAVVINVVAMGIFVSGRLVALWPCVAMMAGSVIGGFVAAKFSQRVPEHRLRTAIVVYGLTMSAIFFARLVWG